MNSRRPWIIVVAALFGLLASVEGAAQPANDAIDTLLALFDRYSVVALGEGDHGNIQGHQFRLRLLRDPRFLEKVDDIVVESGNARYQDLADRYVNGDEVPMAQLRHIWRDTSQASPVWDVEIYEEFFRAVREMNTAAGRQRHLRILLGDPPIDWTDVHGFADLSRQMREAGDRDTHPVRVIQREVIAKNRKALVVYGDVHLQRTPAALKRPCDPAATIPCYPGSIVDQLTGAGLKVFNLSTMTAGADDVLAALTTTAAPRVVDLRNDPLGNQPYRAFQSSLPAMLGPEGQPLPEAPIRAVPMRDIFDGLLYIGPPATITRAVVARDVCDDVEYIAMRKQRMALVAPPGGPVPVVCGR